MDNVRQAVREADLTFPILIDQDKRNWDAWGNSMWPSVYLIDPQGDIRFWWYGELNWNGADGEKRLRQRIEELLDTSHADEGT
jgi:peroxiredoxin